MKNQLVKSFTCLSMTCASLQSLALEPKVTIGFGEYNISTVCFDSGIIRLKNNFLINRPVVETIKFKLENGETFYKTDFTSQKIRFYNRETKNYENHFIAECSDQLVSEFISKPIVKEVEPSTAQAVIYGNLLNNNINDIFQVEWKRYGSMDNYIRYHGEEDRLYMSKDFSVKSSDVDWSRYDHWRDFSTIYRGGDRSGGGSDDITISFKFDYESLGRLSKKNNKINEWFGFTNTYERVIFERKSLPKSLMFIKDTPK